MRVEVASEWQEMAEKKEDEKEKQSVSLNHLFFRCNDLAYYRPRVMPFHDHGHGHILIVTISKSHRVNIEAREDRQMISIHVRRSFEIDFACDSVTQCEGRYRRLGDER